MKVLRHRMFNLPLLFGCMFAWLPVAHAETVLDVGQLLSSADSKAEKVSQSGAQSEVEGATSDLGAGQLEAVEQAQAVSLEQLENQRGTGGVIDVTTIAESQMTGELSNNISINSVNGDNVIDEGSFKEAHGIFSVIQNTGNNVLIQDSTTVNVTIMP